MKSYISISHTVIFYHGSCPICKWDSMSYPDGQLTNLEDLTQRHITTCEAAGKVGLIRYGDGNSGLIEVKDRSPYYNYRPGQDTRFLCEWVRISDNARMVYARCDDPDDMKDKLLFVDCDGHVIETYLVKENHQWFLDDPPWLI